ncbi:MAG: O-antigen ligase family protein [Xenococcaceae cyanobacterium]
MTIFDQLAFVIFGMIFFVSIVFSESLALAEPVGIAKALSCLLAYLYLTWGVGSLVNSFDDAVAITEKFLLIGTALLGIGVIGNLSGLIPKFSGVYAGIFYNGNGTGAYAVLFLPLSVWFLFRKNTPYILKIIPLIITWTAINMSEARSPWLGIYGLLLYYPICWYRYRKKISMNSIWAFLIGFIGITILAFEFLSSMPNFMAASESFAQSLTDPAGGITSYRTSLLWPLYIRAIANSPVTSVLFGHGWGSEETFLAQIRATDHLIQLANVGTAHSAYIGLTFQIGLIGSLLVFGSVWILILKNIGDSSRAVDRERFLFRLAILGVVLVSMCTAFFETGIYNMGAVAAVPTWLAVYMAVRTKGL